MPIWAPVLLGLIVIIGASGTWWYLNTSISTKKSEIKSLDYKLKDFDQIIMEAENATDDRDYLKAQRDFVQGISSNQFRWIEFFDALKTQTPKDVWLDKLVVNRAGEFKVEGETFSFVEVGNFMLQLSKFQQLSGVTLDTAVTKTMGSSAQGGSVKDSMTKIFRINATAKLEPSAAPEASGATPGKAAPTPPIGGATKSKSSDTGLE